MEHVIDQTELFSRCMKAADRLLIDSNRAFLKVWAEPESWPLCYVLFAYHQNMMMCESMTDADLIIETYESEDGEPPHIMGTKDTVVYLALFKKDEGTMPWLVKDNNSLKRIKSLEKGLSNLINIASECDSWESFPTNALDDAEQILQGET